GRARRPDGHDRASRCGDRGVPRARRAARATADRRRRDRDRRDPHRAESASDRGQRMRPWQFMAYDKMTNELVDDVRLPLSDTQLAELFEQLGLTEVTPLSFKITTADLRLVSALVGKELDLERSWYVLEAWMFPAGPAESPGPSWVWRGKHPPGSEYWGAWWHARTGE